MNTSYCNYRGRRATAEKDRCIGEKTTERDTHPRRYGHLGCNNALRSLQKELQKKEREVRGHFKLSCAYTFTHSAKYPASQDRVLATNPRDALSGGPTVFTGVLVRPALTGIAHAAIKTLIKTFYKKIKNNNLQ